MLLKSIFILTLQCSSSWAMRISDNIYITTQSPAIEQQRALQTELIAPAASSVSQYYQPPLLQQRNFFAQSEENPLFIMLYGVHSSETPNIENHSTNQDTYQLYRPSENSQYVEMLPPSEDQSEPNYYDIKPRKNKKYSSKDKKAKKYNKTENLKEKIVKSEEKLDHEAAPSENDYEESDVPQQKEEEEEVTNEQEVTNENEETKQSEDESVEMSQPSSRLDFQMHGHKGPETYKFGYDTGKGKNRQYKVEEKDEKGSVVGQYGYYDTAGKLRVVKYMADDDGFRVL